MTWTLVLCAGISWAGCAYVKAIPMPSEESCFKALAAIRYDEDATGEARRSAVSYCAPFPPQPEPEGDAG